VTDRMDSGRPIRKRPRQVGWFLVFVAIVGLMLGGLAGGFLLGRNLASRPLAAATQLIRQLQPENQRLRTVTIEQNAKLVALQAKLKDVQAALNAITPSANTYVIRPNESKIVAKGRLTIGLIGPPSNESVTVNINGKQHSAATGDIFHIAVDPATTCQVGVQSFDMFSAILTASCAAVKP
jgi:hypothetical protein